MNNNSDLNLEAIENEIASNQAAIELDKILGRLWTNKDFQELILKRYLTDEPARLVKLRASPHVQTNPEILAGIDNAINAIGFFHEFLRGIDQAGQTAEFNLKQNQETRQELLAEVA